MTDLHTMAEELELAYEEWDCYDYDPDSIEERMGFIERGLRLKDVDIFEQYGNILMRLENVSPKYRTLSKDLFGYYLNECAYYGKIQ